MVDFPAKYQETGLGSFFFFFWQTLRKIKEPWNTGDGLPNWWILLRRASLLLLSLPPPDRPHTATILPAGIVKFRPRRTGCLGRVGYVNSTSRNVTSPHRVWYGMIAPPSLGILALMFMYWKKSCIHRSVLWRYVWLVLDGNMKTALPVKFLTSKTRAPALRPRTVWPNNKDIWPRDLEDSFSHKWNRWTRRFHPRGLNISVMEKKNLLTHLCTVWVATMKDMRSPAVSSFRDMRYPPAYNVPSTMPGKQSKLVNDHFGHCRLFWCYALLFHFGACAAVQTKSSAAAAAVLCSSPILTAPPPAGHLANCCVFSNQGKSFTDIGKYLSTLLEMMHTYHSMQYWIILGTDRCQLRGLYSTDLILQLRHCTI